MKLKTTLCALIATAALSGCATIVSDSHYPVSIRSTPSNASFEVVNSNGIVVHSGQTPQTVQLAAGDGFFSGADYTVNFKKDGRITKTVALKSDLDGWYFGNIIFGGVLGILIIDPATGAMFKLPKQVEASLGQQDGQLTIMSIDEVPAPYKANMTAL